MGGNTQNNAYGQAVHEFKEFKKWASKEFDTLQDEMSREAKELLAISTVHNAARAEERFRVVRMRLSGIHERMFNLRVLRHRHQQGIIDEFKKPSMEGGE